MPKGAHGVGIGTAAVTNARLQVNALNGTSKAVVVQGASGQSANIVEVQKPDGTVMTDIDNNGSIFANNGTIQAVQKGYGSGDRRPFDDNARRNLSTLGRPVR